ncbi:MAG: peptidoglycan DD-metalloendopeptidase family protein [bacterium]
MLNFNDIKKSSVYITPNFPVLRTKRYKFGFFRVLAVVAGYSSIVAIFTVLLVMFTPAKQLVLLFENRELNLQAQRVIELEQKLVILSEELQSLQSSNKKLKFAMMLAGTDSIDSSSAIYDSLKQGNSVKNKTGGDILTVFKDFISKYFFNDSSSGSSFCFIKPVNGYLLNSFDEIKGHLGLDFAVKIGSPIFAAANGTVIFADYTIDEGYVIILKHQDDYLTMYKHCSALLKKERDFILQGELIALSGNTGHNSTGPHLHFEIWKDGTTVDPEKLLINNR